MPFLFDFLSEQSIPDKAMTMQDIDTNRCMVLATILAKASVVLYF
jgi:hypothetical protein